MVISISFSGIMPHFAIANYYLFFCDLFMLEYFPHSHVLTHLLFGEILKQLSLNDHMEMWQYWEDKKLSEDKFLLPQQKMLRV